MRLGICLALFVLAPPGWSAPNFTTILGQPTDKSVTVAVRADAAVELYFEYGAKSGAYTGQTKAVTATSDPNLNGYWVASTPISGLGSDTLYYYRMQYRAAGSTAAFAPGAEYSFHTQRQPGSTFVFCVQGDSHPEREKTMFDPGLYRQTLSAVAAARPDFFITSGDDFSVDTLPTPYTQSAVSGRYTLQLPYFDLVGRSSAVFLGTGNHEETSLSNYNLPDDSEKSNQVPIWAQNARNLYYPSPGPSDSITGGFYTGNLTNMPKIGLLRDYYAWEWGDALFVVIDPYWSSPGQVDTGLGGQNSKTPKATDKWTVTHGDDQYQWLKRTLEQSKAKWKFVFAHHVMGSGRGGIEIARDYEWGGNNGNGSWGFPARRPSWPMPVHQLMAANRVTVFFQAHDHLFVREELDGVVYQSLPNPADPTYTAFNADAYKSGIVHPNSGFVKVTVSPAQVKVEYVRQWLAKDERPPAQVSGTVQLAYTIPGGGAPANAPAIAGVTAAGGGAAIGPNTWIEIKGTNLAPASSSRVWQGPDFANGQLPRQLDGVSVTVDGKPAYVYFVSLSQINVLTPPDLGAGTVPLRVTVNGQASAPFTVQAQAVAPAFFAFGAGNYIAATHADGRLIGPASLYPGSTTPARPGETVILYGNGFGTTSLPVAAGSMAQSGTLSPSPVITIGGAPAVVQFAGLVAPGQFQFNVVVPPGAQDGDLPVVATHGAQSTSAAARITVQRQ